MVRAVVMDSVVARVAIRPKPGVQMLWVLAALVLMELVARSQRAVAMDLLQAGLMARPVAPARPRGLLAVSRT